MNAGNDQVNVEIFLDPTLKYSSNMTKDEKKQRWYQKHETLSFWSCANATAQSVKRNHRHHEQQVSNGTAYTDPCSYTNVLLRVFDASCQFNTNYYRYDDEYFNLHYNDVMALEHYSQQWDVRGLERLSIPQLSMLRSKRKRTCCQGVLHAQRILANRIDLSNNEKTNIIRRTSEKYSRPGRLFARSMADADAAIIFKEEERVYHQQKIDFEPPMMNQEQQQQPQSLLVVDSVATVQDCRHSLSDYHQECIAPSHRRSHSTQFVF